MKFQRKLILFFSILFVSNSFAIERQNHDEISQIINAFKAKDKKAIATFIVYPMGREFPIPAIKNESDFLARFNEIFDEYFIKLIADSDLENDWSQMGWRGVMFSNGKLWLNSEGKITAITY
jgi:hypothetical protein